MAQTFHKFRAESLDKAYRAMRKRLGDEAIIVRTTTFKEGGFLGFLSRTVVEVTASAPASDAITRPLSTAERKYLEAASSGGVPTATAAPVGSEERVNDTVSYFQRIISDAQERASAAGEPPDRSGGSGRGAGASASAKGAKSSIVPFLKPSGDKSPGPDDADMQKDISDMREMLNVLSAEMPGAGLPQEFVPAYRTLLERGVDRKRAASLVGAAADTDDPSMFRDSRVFTERLKMQVRRSITTTSGIGLSPGRCKVVALVGATGVGKTTSLAKLAAIFAVHQRARVAVITSDTYRVGAPEQLRMYANIIDLEMKVVNDRKEMVDAIHAFREYDLVLLDTAGGSPYNDDQIGDAVELLEAAKPDEVLLVLSASQALEDLRDVVSHFSRLKPTSLFFTKLDETRRYGALYCLVAEAGLPLSYMSIGQNVPDDIIVANEGMIADLVIEGGEKRGRASTKTT